MLRKQKYILQKKIKIWKDYKKGMCSAEQIACKLEMGRSGCTCVMEGTGKYEILGSAVFVLTHPTDHGHRPHQRCDTQAETPRAFPIEENKRIMKY